jgi:excisionase family DNA binding protein
MDNPFDTIIARLDAIESLLLDNKYPIQPIQKDYPAKCNIDDAASLLGMSKPTLYLLTSQKKIPFYKYGKRLVFDREELEIWKSARMNRA